MYSFSNDNAFTSGKLPIETLIKEIRPVVMEKKELESRMDSQKLAHSGQFGLPEF